MKRWATFAARWRWIRRMAPISIRWAGFTTRWATTSWRKRICAAPQSAWATIPPSTIISASLYMKTGRVKLAASNWERSLEEWNKTVPAEVDADSVAKVQKGTGRCPREAGQTELQRRHSAKTIAKEIFQELREEGAAAAAPFLLFELTALSHCSKVTFVIEYVTPITI